MADLGLARVRLRFALDDSFVDSKGEARRFGVLVAGDLLDPSSLFRRFEAEGRCSSMAPPSLFLRLLFVAFESPAGDSEVLSDRTPLPLSGVDSIS